MRALIATVPLALTLALGAPAFAGGWAVTTLDSLPPDMQSGQTYAVGYTIRQHGVTPVNVEELGGTTAIRVTAPTGAKTLTYKGVQTGPTGHYVAEVIFPYDGAWTWEVAQGPFAPQPLGKIQVGVAAGAASAPAPAAAAATAAAAPVSAAAPATQPTGANGLVLGALLLAISGAALLFGSRLAVFVRRAAA